MVSPIREPHSSQKVGFSLHQDGGFSNLNATLGGPAFKRITVLSINLDVLPTPSPVPFNRSRRETANGALKSVIGVDFRKRISPRCIARYAANTTTPAPLAKVRLGQSLPFHVVSPSMNLHPPCLWRIPPSVVGTPESWRVPLQQSLVFRQRS